MWALRAVVVAALIILVVAFAYTNTGPEQKVDVNLRPIYYDYENVPLVTVVFWAFLGGVVLALLLFITTYIKLSVQMHGAKKRIKALETEVAILRNRPIEESADLLRGSDDQQSEASSAFKES